MSRADCITDENAAYLASLAERTHLTVELGLQTSNDVTARAINRCHTYDDFLSGYYKLRNAGKRIRIGIHIILGLPGETERDNINTAKEISVLCPDEIKIHLLHVLEGTYLAEMYKKGGYTPLSADEYIGRVCRVLELLPPETVIGRLTGDGDRSKLMAPLYSKDKKRIINGIDKLMFKNNTYQGRLYTPDERR